jgi:hypothetical protein
MGLSNCRDAELLWAAAGAAGLTGLELEFVSLKFASEFG